MSGFTRSLSKSKIIAYRQCHKRLWLEVKHPELKEESKETQLGFQIGHNVGEVARHIYDTSGQGILIDVEVEGFDAAFQRSLGLLSAAVSRHPVFEAGCKAAGGLAFADILLPLSQGGWRMVEIKSATSLKPYYKDDLAIQRYVFLQAGIDLKEVALAHIDNQWVYKKEKDFQGLFKEVDLTIAVQGMETEVRQWFVEAHQIIASDLEPRIDTGPHCSTPYLCGFQNYCNNAQPKPKNPVRWLPQLRSRDVKVQLEAGYDEMDQMPDEFLNKLQLRVKNCTLNHKPHEDLSNAQKEMANWKHPLYFLDFETISASIPIWLGTRPYQQVPFQYSLHSLDLNGVQSHTECLIDSGNMPADQLATQLVRDCGSEGSIVTYNAAFERRCLSLLADLVPTLSKELVALRQRVVDLLPVVRNNYYHPNQKGSWSLKSVLPAMVPEMNYDRLEGVKDGGMAQNAYTELLHPHTPKERKQALHRQLITYCQMDTLALLKIWEYLHRH